MMIVTGQMMNSLVKVYINETKFGQQKISCKLLGLVGANNTGF